ncbi:MAG TPA: PhzF family phenazine biosynthesis protein [Noviherbaspirillum sp.]|jgi:PhzF family phenazine biosynthesis protein|uniref:PhzF family phenazine biosynthesis protein n=1 Tax=Noviherbaspirillum sp. TaxID=1926288 RepID=UPI002F95DA5C
MEQRVHIVDAFARDGGGGNPAGVVLQADRLNSAQKLAIAARVGLSETAFVSRSEIATVKLEFFTPSRQIAHCGHATIAAFGYLQQTGAVEGELLTKETIDGIRRVAIRGGRPFMEQLAPTYTEALAFPPAAGVDRIVGSLGIDSGWLATQPVVCSTGNRFLIVHLDREARLAQLAPDQDAIAAVSEALDLIGYYVFAESGGEVAASARMFAPRYGIPEEPATGMAAGPLACYLYDRLGLRRHAFLIGQGAYMQPPSPSRIMVDLQLAQHRIASLYVGGEARLRRTLAVEIAP